MDEPPIHSTPPPVLPQSEPEPEPDVYHQPLLKIPMPPVVIILAIVTIVAFVIGLTRLPESIRMGAAYERAKKTEAQDPKKAAETLQTIVDRYPAAEDIRIDLADAYEKAGEFEKSAEILNTFEGKSITKSTSDRLDEIASRVASHLPKESTQ